jgi:hypothetical protein
MANPKPTKRWMVERWLHKPSGVYLAIYYDKERRKFWGPVGHKHVEADSQDAAVRMANELASALLANEDRWRRVIFISADEKKTQTRYGGYSREQSHNSPRVGFDCFRTWVLDAEDGQRYMRSWNREPEREWDRERLANHQDVRRLSVYVDECVELPYSDELWASLLEFSARLERIRGVLGEMIRCHDFAEMLKSGAVGLLVGGEDDE